MTLTQNEVDAMSESITPLSGGANWLLTRWVEKLTAVLESMTDDHPTMDSLLTGTDELGENALILEQRVISAPDPVLWLGVPESVHQGLGSRILKAAGVDAPDPEDNRATCLEVIEQSIAGLLSAFSQQTGREIKRESSVQCPFFPSGLAVIRVVVTAGDQNFDPIWIAFHPLLISWWEERPVAAAQPASAPAPYADDRFPDPPPTTSRTFDLLLDVALPVSVSFGKTDLAVKDVLKLTTGSIVELNRSVSEPVDVIVNNCIIARGEVVVVEGNYGVRIVNIISRKDRLRTGGAAVTDHRTRVNAG